LGVAPTLITESEVRFCLSMDTSTVQTLSLVRATDDRGDGLQAICIEANASDAGSSIDLLGMKVLFV